MKFNPDIHHRRSIRLKDYDYCQAGAYFVTVCTRERECLLGEIVYWFKTMTTNDYLRGIKQYKWPPFPGKLWQRNYYEHVIRNEDELIRTSEYILTNPAHWAEDEDHPAMVEKNRHIAK